MLPFPHPTHGNEQSDTEEQSKSQKEMKQHKEPMKRSMSTNQSIDPHIEFHK